MQKRNRNGVDRNISADPRIDQALVQLTYLFHDLAAIDPLAQYFVALAKSVLTEKRPAWSLTNTPRFH
jgi:hypothetical protein